MPRRTSQAVYDPESDDFDPERVRLRFEEEARRIFAALGVLSWEEEPAPGLAAQILEGSNSIRAYAHGWVCGYNIVDWTPGVDRYVELSLRAFDAPGVPAGDFGVEYLDVWIGAHGFDAFLEVVRKDLESLRTPKDQPIPSSMN